MHGLRTIQRQNREAVAAFIRHREGRDSSRFDRRGDDQPRTVRVPADVPNTLGYVPAAVDTLVSANLGTSLHRRQLGEHVRYFVRTSTGVHYFDTLAGARQFYEEV